MRSARRLAFVPSGFTMLEMLIYLGLFVAIGAAVTSLFVYLVKAQRLAQRTSEVLDNTRRALEVISQEVRHAESVYTPTSVFGTHPGQLSMETTRSAPSGETTTYVDVYVDSSQLYLKREGEAAQRLTADDVEVDNLVFRHLDPGSTPAVRIELTLSTDTQSSDPTAERSVTFVTTASLRAY